MTTMIKTDTTGVDALTGQIPDNVAELPLLIWDGLIADLGPVPEVPTVDPFDEQPWQQLPTMEQLEELWLVSPLVSIMIHRLAATAHGDGEDLPRYMAQQWQLAELELKLKKDREAHDAEQAESGVDNLGFSADAIVAALGPRRGRRSAARGSKNGDTVVAGGKAAVGEDSGRTPKVPGGRSAGKAGRGTGK